jgi:hypothetical protein
MPAARDWRDPIAGDEDAALQSSDIALGYLSRNPRYRQEYEAALESVGKGERSAEAATEALIETWGLSFVVSAANPYDQRAVIARPDVAPATVVLVEAPAALPEAGPLDLAATGSITTQLAVSRGSYTVLADPQGDHHVWQLARTGAPLALLIPNGPYRAIRLAAAQRLHRHLRGALSGPPPLLLSDKAREHHRRLLRSLDAGLAGAKPREMAAIMIGEHVRGFNAAEWCDSGERRKINRWCAAATRLMTGGYLQLLSTR